MAPQLDGGPQSLVGEGGRHADVDDGDVGAVALDGAAQGSGSPTAPVMAKPRSTSSWTRPSRRTAESSAMATRRGAVIYACSGRSTVTTVGPRGGLVMSRRPSTACTRSVRPDQPAGRGAQPWRAGPARAVVANDEAQPPPVLRAADAGPRGMGMLGHVGQQLGHTEVGDGLDGRGGPILERERELGGDGAARRQGGERPFEPDVERRGMDAAGQVPQLDDGLFGAPVGVVDQLAHLVQLPHQVGIGLLVVASVSSASFSLAIPRRMARATSWAWVPSCRSRSIRRRVAAEESTVWARACSSERTRTVTGSGASRTRRTRRSR